MEPEIENAYANTLAQLGSLGFELTEGAEQLLRLTVISIGKDEPPWPTIAPVDATQSQLRAIEFLPIAFRLLRQRYETTHFGVFQMLYAAKYVLKAYRGFAYP